LEVYDFLKDQGSLIAGLLALVASFLLYWGGRSSAGAEVSALKEQTNILREQNAYLVKENRRKLARESLISIRLIIGALSKIKDDVRDLVKKLEEPQYSQPAIAGNPASVTPRDLARLSRPDIELIWNNLAICGQESIEKFLLLDKRILEVTSGDNSNSNHVKHRLAEITGIIGFLDQELDSEARQCNLVLQD
jgi:hypothetical protein